MQLYARIQGSGPPVVLLHGLFGSNENLGVIARALAGGFTTYSLDLRNHGRSPHANSMDYPSLADDVCETMDRHGLGSAVVLGHSLGGKIAMELALSRAGRVDRLAVVDIAPVTYGQRHDDELHAMQRLDPTSVTSRKQADDALRQAIPNAAIRQFLLKNLARTDHGFAWRIPLDSIARQYSNLAAAPESPGPYCGPTLFIRGGDSDYVTEDLRPEILERFPCASIETIAHSAHWVHVDKPAEFIGVVRRFLQDSIK